MSNRADLHYLFSRKVNQDLSVCEVCPHRCKLRTGQVGRCRVRINYDGLVQPIQNQGIAALGVGDVEEHPLFHFYPGMHTFCLGSTGCTVACEFCQNWELALAPHHGLTWPSLLSADADEIVRKASSSGCKAISFTYNEATVWPELILEVMEAGRRSGLKNVLVTNGFVSERTWNLLLPWLDGLKIDLKGSDNQFYRDVVGIEMQPVLRSLDVIRESGVWHEISTVIIPGTNDSADSISRFVEIILEHSGYHTPWHLMRFFPAYRMIHQQPGELGELRRVRLSAMREGLAYVYISNVPGIPESCTHCHECAAVLFVRGLGQSNPMPKRCHGCGVDIPGHGLA